MDKHYTIEGNNYYTDFNAMSDQVKSMVENREDRSEIIKAMYNTFPHLACADIVNCINGALYLYKNYYQQEIESVREPSTEYGYKMKVVNGGVNKSSKWLNITEDQLNQIIEILGD